MANPDGPIDPIKYQRLQWIARDLDGGAKPVPPVWGQTTWPQEMAFAVQAALDEMERLREILRRCEPGPHVVDIGGETIALSLSPQS